MRHFLHLLSAAALLALPAAAQTYSGDDVTVNLNAIPGGPATQVDTVGDDGNRVLLQPGQPYPGTGQKPPAARHHHRHRAVAAVEPPTGDSAATSMPDTSIAQDTVPAPETPKPRRHTQAAEAQPTPVPAKTAQPALAAESAPPAHRHLPEKTAAAASDNPIPFTFGGDSDETPAPAPTKVAKAEPPPAPLRHAGPAPAADNAASNLAKRGSILFEHAAIVPTPTQLDPIKMLAGDLKTAIDAGATGIQLEAYGGAPGDKSSDARRISLRRALAIRQLLIDDGVPADRIAVKAMGGASDNEQPDRVDVFVRAS
jgi:outer membrane protein OmpA-like peptidoglycan-associated protein